MIHGPSNVKSLTEVILPPVFGICKQNSPPPPFSLWHEFQRLREVTCGGKRG